jgi:hypothetical protein
MWEEAIIICFKLVFFNLLDMPRKWLKVQIVLAVPIPGHFMIQYGWFFLFKLC